MHLDEERGKDEFIFDWGPGTTMEYRASGGYTGSDAGYDVSYIFDGGTQKDVIVSTTSNLQQNQSILTMYNKCFS